jgi:DNA-directed RNA polymerase specialized sigma subunit
MHIARPRPIVQMLDESKREIVDQFGRGITELEIAKELRMKRADVELVLHEMLFGRRMAA